MPTRFCISLLGVLFLFSSWAAGQTTTITANTTVTRDPQAVSLLTQPVNSAFGATGLGTYQDFTATGRIRYFWAGDQVLRSATLLGRGHDQFREIWVLDDCFLSFRFSQSDSMRTGQRTVAQPQMLIRTLSGGGHATDSCIQ